MPPNGATRERRTPSRCVQGSYAPERWWRGDQPWDRTTFSRASAERYDHTSSLVVVWSRRRGSNPRLRLTRAPCCRQHFVDWSRLEDWNPDSPVIGRTSCRWTKPGSGIRVAVGPGFEPGSVRVTSGRVAVATTLQGDRMVGSGGLEPPRACARGRWATDYPTTRIVGVSDGSRTR